MATPDQEELELALEEARKARANDCLPNGKKDGDLRRNSMRRNLEEMLWSAWSEVLRREWKPGALDQFIQSDDFRRMALPIPKGRKGIGARWKQK